MLAIAFSGEGSAPLLDSPTFWVVIGSWACLSFMAIWWLRKGLQNLAATRLLPIEYGTFTSSSVLAGLVVFEEARGISSEQLTQMACGCALMVAGCVLVGSRKALRVEMRCYVDCSSDDAEAEAEKVMERKAALLPTNSPGHHAALRLLMPNARRSDAPESPPPSGLLAPGCYDAHGVPSGSQSARCPAPEGRTHPDGGCGGGGYGWGGGALVYPPVPASVPPLRILGASGPPPPPPPSSLKPISNPASRPTSHPASQPASHPASRPGSKDATPRSPHTRPPSRNAAVATPKPSRTRSPKRSPKRTDDQAPTKAARASATLSV